MNAPRRWWLLVLALLSSCAWTRRENRPVWNSFESHLVPESQAGFVAALPLTVPLGLGAILVDTFVAHPLQVVDDAADDTADLWRGLDFEHHYYTQSGLAPLRAVATPVWFLVSFLGRSCFDIRSGADRDQDRLAGEAQERERLQRWLLALAAGGDEAHYGEASGPLDAELRGMVAEAVARATPMGRLQLFEQAAHDRALGDCIDWLAALEDPSAVVRFRVLQVLPKNVMVPQDLLARLRNDPDEAVRAYMSPARKR